MKKKLSIICIMMAMVLCFSSCSQILSEVDRIMNEITSDVDFSQIQSEDTSSKGFELPEKVRPLLWKAESEKGTVIYFLGSIHVGMEGFYPFDSRLENAYSSSDAVAVEVDVISMEYGVNNTSEQVEKYMKYPDGSTLSDHIDTALYNNVKELLNKYNRSIIPYDKYKPYMLCDLVSYLSSIEASSNTSYDSSFRISAELGVDRHFLSRAKKDGKKVLEVEDRYTRYKMYGDYSDDVQEYLLSSSLYDEYDEDALKLLIYSWAAGDIKELEKSAKYDSSSQEYQKMSEKDKKIYDEYNDAMLTDRNKIMTDKAEEYLKGDTDVLYIVGCAHMVGSDGIIKQLENRGWTVTQEK